MPFKKYQDEERAALVAFLIANGYPNRMGSLRYTQRVTGVDKGQLKRWFLNQDKWCGGEVLVELKMIELKDLLEKHVQANFEEMDKKRDQASFKELAWSGAVMIDKILALEGKASHISESRRSQTWKDIVAEVQAFDPREENKDGSKT